MYSANNLFLIQGVVIIENLKHFVSVPSGPGNEKKNVLFTLKMNLIISF